MAGRRPRPSSVTPSAASDGRIRAAAPAAPRSIVFLLFSLFPLFLASSPASVGGGEAHSHCAHCPSKTDAPRPGERSACANSLGGEKGAARRMRMLPALLIHCSSLFPRTLIVATVMRYAWIAQCASPNAIPDRPPPSPPHGRSGSWRSLTMSNSTSTQNIRLRRFSHGSGRAAAPAAPRPL
jgi:hypothetical protein